MKHATVEAFESQLAAAVKHLPEKGDEPFAEINIETLKTQLQALAEVTEKVTEWKRSGDGPDNLSSLEEFLAHWVRYFNDMAWRQVESALNGGSSHFMSKVRDLAEANAYRQISQQMDRWLEVGREGGKGYLSFHAAHRL